MCKPLDTAVIWIRSWLHINKKAFAYKCVCVWFSGVREENRLLARCALHLRKFNDALLINDTVRMVDSLRLLEEFYTTEARNVLDITDEFLTGLFNGTNSVQSSSIFL